MLLHRKSLLLIVALAAAVSLVGAGPCTAATWTVTSTADDGSAGTLRAILASAADGDTITFDLPAPTFDLLMPATIYLDSTLGPLQVNKSLTITGPAADLSLLRLDDGGFADLSLLYLDGGGSTGVLTVAPGVTVTISNLSIVRGYSKGFAGGGVTNLGTLTLAGCMLEDNFAPAGGAILNAGALTLTDCVLNRNSGLYVGGAIINIGGDVGEGEVAHGTLTINHCLLYDNWTSGYSELGGGGAITNIGVYGEAAMTIQKSILAVNYSVSGGAIANLSMGDSERPGHATATIDSSSLIYNETGAFFRIDDGGGSLWGFGGAICNAGFGDGEVALTLKNSTLGGNWADVAGGAVFNGLPSPDGPEAANAELIVDNDTLADNEWDGIANGYGGVVSIKNTILDNAGINLDIAPFSGGVTSYGYNLCSDDGAGFLTATGDQIKTEPLLDDLGDNGGLTPTYALLPDSPAIDAADSTDIGGHPVKVDQRGVPRPQGSANDIGAFEYSVSHLFLSDVQATRRKSGDIRVTLQINNPLDGTTVEPDVTVTGASLGEASTSSVLPLLYGVIKPGGSKQCTLQFPSDVPSGSQTLILEGHSLLGDFSTSVSVDVP